MKRRGARKAKSESAWNRRLKVERSERAQVRAERNDWSLTAPRGRAKGRVAEDPEPGGPWVRDEPDGGDDDA